MSTPWVTDPARVDSCLSLIRPGGGGGSYRRGETDINPTYERSRTSSGGGGGGGGFGRSNFLQVGTSRDRHSDGVTYPLQTISTQRSPSQRSPAQRVPPGGVASQTGNIYNKMAGGFAADGVAGITAGVKSRPAPADPAALSRIAPEIFSRATEALENIRKTVASAGGLPLPPSGRMNPPQGRIGPQLTMAQLQQLATVAAGSRPQHSSAADFMQRISLGGAGMSAGSRQPVVPGIGASGPNIVGGGKPHLHGGGLMGGKPHPHGQGKLPPEDERYNRRLSRPQGHQQRPASYKRLI